MVVTYVFASSTVIAPASVSFRETLGPSQVIFFSALKIFVKLPKLGTDDTDGLSVPLSLSPSRDPAALCPLSSICQTDLEKCCL